MAHELTHVINRDVMIMTLASFFASIASMIVQFGFFFGGGYGGDDDDDDGPSFIVVILVSVARLRRSRSSYAGAVALPRVRRRPRRRGPHRPPERARLGAAEDQRHHGAHPAAATCAPHAEMNAFYIFPASAKKSIFNLFSTHPPLEKRIARAAAPGGPAAGRRPTPAPPSADGLPRRPARPAQGQGPRARPAVRDHDGLRRPRDRARASRPAARRRSSSSRWRPSDFAARSSPTWRRSLRGTGEETGTTVDDHRRRRTATAG